MDIKNYVSKLLCNNLGKELGADAHRAVCDVDATSQILIYPKFWHNREKWIMKVDCDGIIDRTRVIVTKVIPTPNDDSDTDMDDANDSESETDKRKSKGVFTREVMDEDENLQSIEDTSFGWVKDTGFDGIDSTALFTEAINKQYSTRDKNTSFKVGIQCSVNSVNSPIKAWRQIFTNSILEKIVKYTNEYGSVKSAETWENITKSDLTDFISCLFISSIQKRKDKTSNWWKSDPVLENNIMKKIMSGRKFPAKT